MPPFLMMAARSLIAGTVLFAWARLREGERPAPGQWRAAVAVGTLLFLGCHGLLAWAELLTQEHDWPAAIAACEKAMAADPADARVYYRLFSLYRKQGNAEKAQWALEKYKQLEPKRAVAR